MCERMFGAGALSIRPFQVSRWRLRRTRHPWVLNAVLVPGYWLEGALAVREDRSFGGLITGTRLDNVEMLAVSLLLRLDRPCTDRRVAWAA